MSRRPWKIYSGVWPPLFPEELYFVTAFKYRAGAERRARKMHAAALAKPRNAAVESPIIVVGPQGTVFRLWLDEHRQPHEQVS